ncbi:MAG: resolvase [Bacilli bacterium]|nr:resolvase [Bacilli bacterium]
MKACIYTRVSTTSQVDEGFSLAAQYDQLVKFVEAQGWDLVRIYTDPGVSAKDLNRPGIQEMIADLKDGKFETLIIHKLDRLTRNISDLYDLVDLVIKKEIKLISLSENIDTATPMGRMFIYMLGILAQMFRENLSQEIKKGMTQRAEQGFRNTFAPYGYEINEEGTLTIIPEQAELIREIFDMLLIKKWGYSTIAKKLNERNETGIRGGIFHGSSIERILNNHTYAGMNHWKRKELSEDQRIIREGGHVPIIDKETFERAQNIIGRRSRKEMSRSSFDYPYSTIIHCGKCGAPYHGMTQTYKRSTKYYYYRCNGKTLGKCDQSDLSEVNFEKLFFKHFDFTREVNYVEVAAAKEDHEKERKRIERDLNKSEQRRKNWQYAFGDGKMPYEDYTKLMDEEMNRVHELNQSLRDLPTDKTTTLTRNDVIETIAALKENWNFVERINRKEFINSLFKRIDILKTGKVWEIVQTDFV